MLLHCLLLSQGHKVLKLYSYRAVIQNRCGAMCYKDIVVQAYFVQMHRTFRGNLKVSKDTKYVRVKLWGICVK